MTLPHKNNKKLRDLPKPYPTLKKEDIDPFIVSVYPISCERGTRATDMATRSSAESDVTTKMSAMMVKIILLLISFCSSSEILLSFFRITSLLRLLDESTVAPSAMIMFNVAALSLSAANNSVLWKEECAIGVTRLFLTRLPELY